MAGAAWLFTPADRPERLAGASAQADVLVADLEDAVAPARRDVARQALVTAALDPARTFVRVNAVGTADLEHDLEAVTVAGLRKVMLPKVESAADIARLEGFEVIALCETPRGILEAAAIAAAPGCVGLMWGSEDLAAGLGAWSSRDEAGLRPVLLWARAMTLTAARAAGVLAIDAVDPRIAHPERVATEAAEAAAAGFDGKACIHPVQIPLVRDAFRPPVDRIEWAARVLAASPDGAAVAVDGELVDEAILRTARRLRELTNTAG